MPARPPLEPHVNWYTAVDPKLQGQGVGERMVTRAYRALLDSQQDGTPISREGAYNVLRGLYTSEYGYDVAASNGAVERLDSDYQQHPQMFDQLAVAPDIVHPNPPA